MPRLGLSLRTTVIIYGLLLRRLFVASSSTPRVWPACQQERYGDYTRLALTASKWEFAYSGYWATVNDDDDDHDDDNNMIRLATGRFVTAVNNKIVKDEQALLPLEIDTIRLEAAIQSIHIHISTPDKQLQHGVGESYRLDIFTQNNTIRLVAPTIYGAMHGLQTLLQLTEFAGWIYDSSNTPEPFFQIRNTPIHIEDAPLYPYRGLLIDTSRHYLPVSLILHNLLAMEMNKLNVLHWHITDSQSWPFASERFPELQKGAFCQECVYTPQTIRHVIRQAKLRGIRIVFEVDLPGHCQGTCVCVCA